MSRGILGKWKQKLRAIAFPTTTQSPTTPSVPILNGSPPISSKDVPPPRFEVARNPKESDEKLFLEDPVAYEKRRREQLVNDSNEQDIGERLRYASHAYGITQAWIGFLMVLTLAQFILKPLGMGLSDSAFIAVFTTITASVFGFWLSAFGWKLSF